MKLLLVIGVLGGLFVSSYTYYLYSEVKQRFSARRWSVPSRVFSATVPIYPGQSVSLPQLRQMLEERRYQESIREPIQAGEYRSARNGLVVHLREFRFPGHTLASQRVLFEFQQNRLARIRGDQGDVAFLELEPLEIARLFGPERESRLLVNIDQVPRHLVDAVVAIEDHRFYEHGGVDWLGILRALFKDLRAGRAVQGGSTITQQLIKNYFLQPEKSFERKFMEAYMALILEAMYGKDEILEMYFNEIYLGQRGSIAIHGIGEASRYYFGRNVEDLSLAEAATLAGIIRGPNSYSPILHPDASRERRNAVLKRMLELEKISQQDYDRARIEPIRLPAIFLPVNVAPYFVDYVRQQLHELYAPEILESEGLNIYTSLHPEMALAAEKALHDGLQELENEHPVLKAASPENSLQGVLVVVQPKTGAMLALMGGRDYGESTFNRALYAHRQPGSAIKPFVYLSALDRYTPATWIADEPTAYRVEGLPWTPKNYDDKYRGRVMFRSALEESLNAATVGLAMDVGLDNVIGTLRSFGIQSPLKAVPSLALGAFEVTPLELAGAYMPLDNDGQKPYLLGLKEVVTESGEVQERRHMDLESVTSPAKAYLITDILQGAVERGTGKPLKRLGIDFPCAGKTGTT
ncbi:MAG: transglycosylase domain-containing protein, partial [Acidobacteriota bacterium]